MADAAPRQIGTSPGRVAVVIPTYNRAALLRRAIASIRQQTRAAACELVIVDDGSTDNTAEVVRELAPEALYIRRQQGGPAAARNAGMDASDAPFIAFLDSDDEWLPDKIEDQLAAMREWPDVVLVAGPAVGEALPDVPLGRPVALSPALLSANLLTTSTVMLRRSALRPGDRFPEHLRHVEDYVLWLRAALRGPCVFLPSPAVRRAVEHSDRLSLNREAMLRGWIEAYRLIEPELRQRPELRPLLHAAQARALAHARDWHLRHGRAQIAFACALRSLRKNPWGRPLWEWTAPLSALARALRRRR